ncbi:MAG: nucleoside hydrolase [Candidatus Brocadiia bacterium]
MSGCEYRLPGWAIADRPLRWGTGRLAIVLTVSFMFCVFCVPLRAGESAEKKPIPVIFDTDIGEDIDDLWALVYLVRSPEIDVKLITTGFTLPVKKAKIVAKTLGRIGRTDIPVGAGVGRRDYNTNYRPWVDDFDLKDYKGKVYKDGVGKLIETVYADKSGRLKIIAVGPMQTLAGVLKRDPSIAKKAELIAMAGNFSHLDKKDSAKLRAESNVRCKIPEAQKVFAANWKKILVAPAESSRRVQLFDERYKHVRHSDDPGAKTIMEVYDLWEENANWANYDTKTQSSHLYDTMAVHMAWNTSPFKIEPLLMRVTDRGHTVVEKEKGHRVFVARKWVDDDELRHFKTELVRRIAGSLPRTGVRLGVADATASVNQEQARKVLTGGKLHRQNKAWSARRTDKKSQWFQLELSQLAEVRMLKVAFAHGRRWPEKVEIRTSTDGNRWQTLLDTVNKTKTSKFKSYKLKPTRAKYIRVVVKGHGTWHATIVKGVRVYGLRAERPQKTGR